MHLVLCSLGSRIQESQMPIFFHLASEKVLMVSSASIFVSSKLTRRLLWWLRLQSLPTMWETWVQSLGGEDPLEKGMATHSRILAWRIPWTEESGRLQSMRSPRVRHE